jgi:hypothetical protein
LPERVHPLSDFDSPTESTRIGRPSVSARAPLSGFRAPSAPVLRVHSYEALPAPLSSAHGLSQTLDGLLLAAPRGLISCHRHPWGSHPSGFSPPRRAVPCHHGRFRLDVPLTSERSGEPEHPERQRAHRSELAAIASVPASKLALSEATVPFATRRCLPGARSRLHGFAPPEESVGRQRLFRPSTTPVPSWGSPLQGFRSHRRRDVFTSPPPTGLSDQASL